MLPERFFQSTGDELLYHYCTPSAYQAICENKTIRFSDIFSMNDFMEMHWGYDVWQSVATKAINDLGKEFIDSVDAVISESGVNILPLAACFSTQGDVLSQWRAYADDGKGFCIGFSAKHVTQLAARPLQVLYNREQQEQELERAIRVIHEVRMEGNSSDSDFMGVCAALACDLASYKNPAFVEESEVRLLHIVAFAKSNEGLKLQAIGGTSFGEQSEPQRVGFTMRGSVPVPHVDLSILDPKAAHPIAEVLLGPRNDALPSAVSVFLETSGIGGVVVRKSIASYR